MSIDDKVRKTLAELKVSDAAGVESLFLEAEQAGKHEYSGFFSSALAEEHAAKRAAKSLRDRWLARGGGIISLIDQNWLKAAAKDLKPTVGSAFNGLRVWAMLAFNDANLLAEWARTRDARAVRREERVVQSSLDLTLPGNRRAMGSIHPVTRVMREIEDIFLGLGFSIETGPEIETTYYNFDALNIPESHPARDDWDTLYINPQTLLRTHTSPVQIHAMEKHGAPLYIICPGKCYRHDNPDSSHATMFHQVEGLAVDTDISFADLKGTLDFFARKFFGEKIRTNFFPSFFPFTEPSGDVAISCTICDGKGCRVCKESGWLEVMGCGMVHPDVLEHGGIDPKKYSGWAFGLGVERFAMMKYGVNDIQLFTQSDVRFLNQF
jgi:phenylalanyl-tRNA synthetase alpha chain